MAEVSAAAYIAWTNLTLRPRIERQVVFDGDFRTFKNWRFACSPVLAIKNFNDIIEVLDELTALDPALDPGREVAADAEPAGAGLGR